MAKENQRYEAKDFKDNQQKAIDYRAKFINDLNNIGKICWVVRDNLFGTTLVKIIDRPEPLNHP